MLSLKRPLTTRDKAQVGFFLLHMGGMAWILLSPSPQPAATATTASSPPSRAFSWLAALALAVAAGAGLGAACLRALLYQPSTRRALIRQAPFLSAGAQAALALLLLVRLPWCAFCLFVCLFGPESIGRSRDGSIE